VKGGEAVEGCGWARKVQVVGKFLVQHSAVVKMVWSNEQRAFAVETYFSQGHSIVAVQRAFRTRYQIPPRERVPNRKSILLWVENFRETGRVSEKNMRTITELSNTREHRGCRTVRFAVSQVLCTQNTTQTTVTTCKIFFLRLCDLKLPML